MRLWVFKIERLGTLRIKCKPGTLAVTLTSIVLLFSCYTLINRIKVSRKLVQEQTALVQEQSATINEMNEHIKTLEQQKLDNEEQIQQLQQALIQKESSEWSITPAVATAYSPFDNIDGIQAEGNGNVTSIGLTPGPNVIAVDPEKVPYGSEMVVIYQDGTVLKGIAGDTGGALRDAEYVLLDIFRNTHAEAIAHGKQNVTLLYKSK